MCFAVYERVCGVIVYHYNIILYDLQPSSSSVRIFNYCNAMTITFDACGDREFTERNFCRQMITIKYYKASGLSQSCKVCATLTDAKIKPRVRSAGLIAQYCHCLYETMMVLGICML